MAYNLGGQRFGRLTVLSLTNKRTKQGNNLWLCKCDCGTLREVISTNLVRGHTKSCGCISTDRIKQYSFKSTDICIRGHSRINNIRTNNACITCDRLKNLEPKTQWRKMKWKVQKRIKDKRIQIAYLESEIANAKEINN